MVVVASEVEGTVWAFDVVGSVAGFMVVVGVVGIVGAVTTVVGRTVVVKYSSRILHNSYFDNPNTCINRIL